MAKSIVTLKVNGRSYTGWKSININLSIENLSGSFFLEMATKGGDKAAIPTGSIKPGDACLVAINNKIIITGYIDKLAPSYDATTHTIGIYGRDKAGDLVDSSIINITGQFLNQTIDKIIKTITAPYNVPVQVETDIGAPLKTFSIEQSSTVFQTIQKLCNLRQVLCISDGKGGIKITRSGNSNAKTSLVEGINILAGRSEYDYSERFQIYQVKGQKQALSLDSPESSSQAFGEFKDTEIKRYRTMLTIADGQVDSKICEQIAKWEGRVRTGKSAKLNVTVAGFADSKNELWDINTLVQIRSPLLYVDGTLLISSINFRLDDNGEITDLALTSKESFETMDISKLKKSQMNPYMLSDDYQFRTNQPPYYPKPQENAK